MIQSMMLSLFLSSLTPQIDNAEKHFRMNAEPVSNVSNGMLVCKVIVFGKDGGGWDAFGGAPDVVLSLQTPSGLATGLKSGHRSYISLSDVSLSKGQKLLVTLTDKDEFIDDPIGSDSLRFDGFPLEAEGKWFELRCRSIKPSVVKERVRFFTTLAKRELKEKVTSADVDVMTYRCPMKFSKGLRGLEAWSSKDDANRVEILKSQAQVCKAFEKDAALRHRALLKKAAKLNEWVTLDEGGRIRVMGFDRTKSLCTAEIETSTKEMRVFLSAYDEKGRSQMMQEIAAPERTTKRRYRTGCNDAATTLLYVRDAKSQLRESRVLRLTK